MKGCVARKMSLLSTHLLVGAMMAGGVAIVAPAGVASAAGGSCSVPALQGADGLGIQGSAVNVPNDTSTYTEIKNYLVAADNVPAGCQFTN